MTNILYVDWFLLETVSQARSLTTAAREYRESQQHGDLRKSGMQVHNLTWNNLTNQSGIKRL